MDIILDDGSRKKMAGRVAALVLWLLRNERRVERDKIELTFHCAGPKITAELRERERLDAALLR